MGEWKEGRNCRGILATPVRWDGAMRLVMGPGTASALSWVDLEPVEWAELHLGQWAESQRWSNGGNPTQM